MPLNRPKIKIELDLADRVMEGLGILALLTLIGLPIYYYGQLPDSIPRHYGINGEADAYSGKAILWTLPMIGILMFAGLFFLSRKPELYNYPQEVTPENAEKMYKSGAKLIRVLNTIITLAFAYITFSTIRTALGTQSGLGLWFTPVFLGVIFLSMGFYILQFVKKGQKANS